MNADTSLLFLPPPSLDRRLIPYLELIPEGYREQFLCLLKQEASRFTDDIAEPATARQIMARVKEALLLWRSNAARNGDDSAGVAANAMLGFTKAFRMAGLDLALFALKEVRRERFAVRSGGAA